MLLRFRMGKLLCRRQQRRRPLPQHLPWWSSELSGMSPGMSPSRCYDGRLHPTPQHGQTNGSATAFSTLPRPTLTERRKKQIAYLQSYKCNHCKVLLPPDYQIDHIVPVALHGHSGTQNLQALCKKCHALKTQQDLVNIQQLPCPEVNPAWWHFVDTATDPPPTMPRA